MSSFVPFKSGKFLIKLADKKEEFDQMYRLRYEELLLFYNQESTNKDEMFIDEYDPVSTHLICLDTEVNQVVGTYRVITKDDIKEIGYFSTELEYDISNLKERKIAELGRAVIKGEYRTGAVLSLLWRGLIEYVTSEGIEFLFGTVSFEGQDNTKYHHAFSKLYYNHLSPLDIRAFGLEPGRDRMNFLKEEEIDPAISKKEMPPLIKGYIKLGATFGNDIYYDTDFNCIDVFVLLELEKINKKFVERLFR